MLLNLHLLRAFAALAVVYFHITSPNGLNLSPNIGSHGVDVFFVMSGFIIAYIGARSPDRFLVRRFIRIVPFYWTATLAIFALSALVPQYFHSTRPDVVQLVCSLFFVPRQTSYSGMVPTLLLGWSLNYEMYFYVLFALALAIAPRIAPLTCSMAIVTIGLVIDASGFTHPSVVFYAQTLVYEFVFGVAVYYVFVASERHVDWFKQRRTASAALQFAAFAAALFIGVEEFYGGFGWPRFVAAGLPAMVLVLSALLLERLCGVRTTSKAIFLLGESSYVLYLVHPYVVYGLIRTLLGDQRPQSAIGTAGLVVGLLLISTLLAVVIHVALETPVMAHLRRRFLRPSRPPTSADRVQAVDGMSQTARLS